MKSSRRARWLVAIAVTAFVAVIAGKTLWRLFTPKIHSASLAEIKSVIPPELLIEKPEDPDAQARYKQFTSLIQRLNKEDVTRLVNNSVGMSRPGALLPGASPPKLIAPTPKEQLALAKRIWDAKPELPAQIEDLLTKGPLQQQRPKDLALTSFPELAETKSFVKVAALSADIFAKFGDSERSMKLLTMAIKFCDRMFASDGVLIDYLVAVADDAIVSRSIQRMASRSAFPVEDCRSLLAILPPSQSGDEAVIAALRSDFQRFALPLLASDPRKALTPTMYSLDENSEQSNSRPVVGTYEALGTAKEYGRNIASALANLGRPLSNYDSSVDKVVDREADLLPKEPDPEKPGKLGKWWDEMGYRFAMNNSANTIGRTYIANQFGVREVLIACCRQRAWRDLIRLLLASRIYRLTHGGRLPSSAAGFLPFIGMWPQDPFNGKLMIYLPKKAIVYSVGKDLVDDGGSISPNPIRGSDFGISLELDVPEPTPKT